MALTERQKEIQKFLDQDKTPAEIAKLLKPQITVNAVYQQLRRMHKGTKTKGRKAPARKPAVKRATTTPRAGLLVAAGSAPKIVTELRDMTPLQAIRARKVAIEGELRESASVAAAAAKAAAASAEGHTKLVDKRKDELGQLVKAESALTGRPVIKAANKKRQRAEKPATNGSGDAGDAAAAVADGGGAVADVPAEHPVPAEGSGAPAPLAETPAAA